MEYIINIVKNVLTAVYQQFWAALVLSVFFMFVYMYAAEHGWKKAVSAWMSGFCRNREFRRIFFLVFYTAMILFRTLLCRSTWINPLVNVLGIWSLHNAKGEIYTENIENAILFIPFTILLFYAFKSRLFKTERPGAFSVLLRAAQVSFLFSLAIESCQLFLKLGTFQISDLVFNTLGGIIGGMAFLFVRRIVFIFRIRRMV